MLSGTHKFLHQSMACYNMESVQADASKRTLPAIRTLPARALLLERMTYAEYNEDFDDVDLRSYVERISQEAAAIL